MLCIILKNRFLDVRQQRKYPRREELTEIVELDLVHLVVASFAIALIIGPYS
jgi:hypothetical protein